MGTTLLLAHLFYLARLTRDRDDKLKVKVCKSKH